ncbi:MAG: hypothetical protein GKR89_24555 [Candidatus Latescibacteria bacterium]|nr:hypothetical protein [Candidatus Latescibacterota bacterium]
MSSEPVSVWAFFVFSLVLAGLLFAGVTRLRGRDEGLGLPKIWVEARLHYALIGVLAGYALAPTLSESMRPSLALAMVFFGTWFGLIAGCDFDLATVRRAPRVWGGLEMANGCGIALAILGVTYLVGDWVVPEQGHFVSVLLGLCLLGGPRWPHARGGKGVGRQGIWLPSWSTLLGVACLGLGSSQLRAGSMRVIYPFSGERGFIVEGGLEEMVWSLVLGGLVGIIGDLIMRESEGRMLFYLLVGAVLLGGGIAAALGLEPLWVGLAAGLWLINATLRRVDILRVVEQSSSTMQPALLFGAGWLWGDALRAADIDWPLTIWIWVLLVLVRPLARLAVLQGAQPLVPAHILSSASSGSAALVRLDILVLAGAASLSQVLPPRLGSALLGAGLLAQLSLGLATWAVYGVGPRFPKLMYLVGQRRRPGQK